MVENDSSFCVCSDGGRSETNSSTLLGLGITSATSCQSQAPAVLLFIVEGAFLPRNDVHIDRFLRDHHQCSGGAELPPHRAWFLPAQGGVFPVSTRKSVSNAWRTRAALSLVPVKNLALSKSVSSRLIDDWKAYGRQAFPRGKASVPMAMAPLRNPSRWGKCHLTRREAGLCHF